LFEVLTFTIFIKHIFLLKIPSMKSLLTLFLAFSFISSHAQGIEFFKGTYQEAIAEAAKQERILFVDAYTTWCGPCKRMSKQVFTQAKAGDLFNANFINYKIDMEKPNGREFGSKYPVSAYPTLFFIDGEGKLVKKSVGGKSVEALVSLGSDILAKFDFSTSYREAYEAGDRSFENTIAYVNALNKSNKSSLKIANEFLLEKNDLTPTQKSDFIFAAASEVDSRIFEKMLDDKSTYIAKFGQAEFDDKIMRAAKRTRNKALKFDSQELLDASIKTVKKHNKSEYKKFQAESYMKKAELEENVVDYLKNSKKLLKVLPKASDKVNWAQNTMALFPKNKEVLNLAFSTLEKPLANSIDKNEITMFCKILLEQKRFKDALAYAKGAESRVTDGATRKHLLSLISYIEKQIS